MLQDSVNTDKLQLLLADPLYLQSMSEFLADPLKDITLSEAERSHLDIPMYSLSEVYPDFKQLFKPLKTLIQEVPLASLAGSVERQYEHYTYGFVPLNPDDLEIQALVSQIQSGQYDSKQKPIRVHAIPFGDKFEGFVADGAVVVAAAKLAGKTTIWAQVTFYKQLKK
ncbi:MAG: hypothetical protein V1846_02245 [Candidatus Komeilibacteria bacterium]